MFDFGRDIKHVYCVVFTTAEVIGRLMDEAKGPALLFAHHPHDYHEDERGLGPFPETCVGACRDRQVSVYTIHAPLDVGRSICVSKSLAARLRVTEPQPFFEAAGGHLGVMGMLPHFDPYAIAAHVARSLDITTSDVFDYGCGKDGRVAVVAGGGDQKEILQQAIDLGCTTYITGTAVHRWSRAREGNREFHELARAAKINLIGASHHNTEKCAVHDVVKFLQERGIPASYLADPVLDIYDIGNYRP
jgi:putative NIF3 family GTP cyclohydrolase 1 type 2